jgi:hypothetical protein
MTESTTPGPERMQVQRTIATDPATIFAVLSDPRGHVTIDSSGMLQAATGEPVTAVGDSFVVRAIFPVIPETALRATLGILARTVAPQPA